MCSLDQHACLGIAARIFEYSKSLERELPATLQVLCHFPRKRVACGLERVRENGHLPHDSFSQVFAVLWVPTIFGAQSLLRLDRTPAYPQAPIPKQLESNLREATRRPHHSISSEYQHSSVLQQVLATGAAASCTGLLLQSALWAVASRTGEPSLDSSNILGVLIYSTLLLLNGALLLQRVLCKPGCTSRRLCGKFTNHKIHVTPVMDAAQRQTGLVHCTLVIIYGANLTNAISPSLVAYAISMAMLPIVSIVMTLQSALGHASATHTERAAQLQTIVTRGTRLTTTLYVTAKELVLAMQQFSARDPHLTADARQTSHDKQLSGTRKTAPGATSSGSKPLHAPFDSSALHQAHLQRLLTAAAAMHKWARDAAVQANMAPTQCMSLHDVLLHTLDSMHDCLENVAYDIQLPDIPPAVLFGEVEVAAADLVAAVAASAARTSVGAGLALDAADRIVRVQVALRVRSASAGRGRPLPPLPAPDAESLGARVSDTTGTSTDQTPRGPATETPHGASARSGAVAPAMTTHDVPTSKPHPLLMQLYCVISQHAHKLTAQQLDHANATHSGSAAGDEHMQDSWVHVREARRRLRLMKGDVRVVPNSAGYSIIVMLPLRLRAVTPAVTSALHSVHFTAVDLPWQWVHVYGAVRGHASRAAWCGSGLGGVGCCAASRQHAADRLRDRCCGAVWMTPSASQHFTKHGSSSSVAQEQVWSVTTSVQHNLVDVAILKTTSSFHITPPLDRGRSSGGTSSEAQGSPSTPPPLTSRGKSSSTSTSAPSPLHSQSDSSNMDAPQLNRRLSNVKMSSMHSLVLQAAPPTYEGALTAVASTPTAPIELSDLTDASHSDTSGHSTDQQGGADASITSALHASSLVTAGSRRARAASVLSDRDGSTDTHLSQPSCTESTIRSLRASPYVVPAAGTRSRRSSSDAADTPLSRVLLTPLTGTPHVVAVSAAVGRSSSGGSTGMDAMEPLVLPPNAVLNLRLPAGDGAGYSAGADFGKRRATARAMGASPGSVILPDDTTTPLPTLMQSTVDPNTLSQCDCGAGLHRCRPQSHCDVRPTRHGCQCPCDRQTL